VQAAATTQPIGKVSAKVVESFTRELANLLAGGVPLSRSLSLLRREAANDDARQLWNAIHDDVVGGTALADAMAKYPRNFSTVYVAMIRAGEAGGFLDVVLAQIADFRTREQDLKGKVKMAMVYPIILALLAVGVLVFLLTFFIPRFSGIFAQFGANLPSLTLFIIAASNLVKHYGLFVLAGAVIGVVAFKRIVSTSAGRRNFEMLLLAVPMLGQIIAHFALVRFARMLGTLVGAGVPLVASLRVAREAIGNQVLADTVTQAIGQVQQGTALSKSLASSPKLFPGSVVEMIAVAEETGRLDKELLRLAAAYEADLDRQLKLLVAVAEPLMLFVMAGVIGTVVVGMLLPVFNLQDLIH
jgi:type II secretory pathway component PulF